MANTVFGVMMPYAVFGAAMPPPFSAEAYWKVRKYPAEGFMNFPLWYVYSSSDLSVECQSILCYVLYWNPLLETSSLRGHSSHCVYDIYLVYVNSVV